MIALTLATVALLQAGPLDPPPAERLTPDAAAAYRRAESRRDLGLGFKFFAAVGALGVVGTGGAALVFGIREIINVSNGYYGVAADEQTKRNLALASCGASAGLLLVSGVVGFMLDVWAERLTRDAAATR